MTKTTVDKVRYTAPAIKNLSDDALNMFIDDAFLEVQAKGFPTTIEEKANRYLACHLATANDKYVKSEQVGTLKREYSERNVLLEGLETTPYGQEYLRLLDEYVNDHKGLSMVVI